MRVLIAEDETELARGLKFLLEKNKFTVDVAHDGGEALTYFRDRDYDVVILDIMMPKVNGLDVLREIRGTGSGVPVLMLTAKAEIEDRAIRLNNKEFQLMELFMRNPRFVFSTAHLMDKIWGQDSEADVSVGWTYVGFLRKKLKELKADIEIRTARGAGYYLDL